MSDYELAEPYRGFNRFGVVESSRPAIRQLRYPGALCIPLTQGQYAIVNEADYWREDVAPYLWCARWCLSTKTFQAVRHGPSPERKFLRMHAVITGYAKTDHWNHNGLDNRRFNLRDVTDSQNGANRRLQSNNRSGHVGVRLDERTQAWYAQIGCNRDIKSLGRFGSYKAAVAARHAAQISLFGEFSPQCCDQFERMLAHATRL